MTVVKNPTQWRAPDGAGYFNASGNLPITTQSGVNLLTQSGEELLLENSVYSAKYPTSWVKTGKNPTQYLNNGSGFVDPTGSVNIVTNSGSYIITNSGNKLIVNPTVSVPKYPTQWTGSGV